MSAVVISLGFRNGVAMMTSQIGDSRRPKAISPGSRMPMSFCSATVEAEIKKSAVLAYTADSEYIPGSAS